MNYTMGNTAMNRCNACGAAMMPGTAFCPQCGTNAMAQQRAVCPTCSVELPPGAAFCPQCGTNARAQQRIVCPKCGTELPSGATFCPQCGLARGAVGADVRGVEDNGDIPFPGKGTYNPGPRPPVQTQYQPAQPQYQQSQAQYQPVQTQYQQPVQMQYQPVYTHSSGLLAFEPLKKYAVFTGRARRREFWQFSLFNFCVGFVLSVWALIANDTTAQFGFGSAPDALYTLFVLGMFVPNLAVVVRRLHDVGKSGWNYCWCFTIIGIIPVFIWLCKDSERNTNMYGPSPKYGEA